MHLLILVPLFIAAFIAGCIFAFVVHELRQGLKRRRKRNSRATDDVELGVIVPEGASEEKGTDVECKNEPRGCHSNVTSEGSAQERLRHVDSEDEPGGRGGEGALHAFAKFGEDLSRDLMNMAQLKRGGTVVVNHWIPPSYDEMLRRHTPSTRILNVPYEYGALSRIFDTSRQGHDGAVIIDLFDEISEEFQPTVRCCGYTFPINERPAWDVKPTNAANGGTRRTSALRMSHYTNCSIFVVSEDEGGSISHFRMGERQRELTSNDIRHIIEDAYQRAYVLKLEVEGEM
ncbi:hypothetical protein AAVH_17820 [Aphelenchoides avenae]|nr:hypothetical protein AAVH_17820 [Aphelenchus avenae]